MNPDDAKSNVHARFSQFAQNYVDSPVHAGGSDLDRLLEVAQPQPGWQALDVATGGGHTALKLAPHVGQMIAADFSTSMLSAARTSIDTKGVTNIAYVGSDAEQMPFPANTFDLVTCRVAAHHFPDAYRFFLEAARVLKAGGRLVVQDHLLPEDKRAGEYLEAFERLRDPSHGRAFSTSEWQGLMLDADFEVEHTEQLSRAAELVSWAERQGCTTNVIARLQILLAQAPPAVADWIRPRSVLSPDAGFDHVYILIVGRKK